MSNVWLSSGHASVASTNRESEEKDKQQLLQGEDYA